MIPAYCPDWTPADVLWALARLGYSCRAEGGKLPIAPAGRLTEEDRALIARHREGMLAILTRPTAALPSPPCVQPTLL